MTAKVWFDRSWLLKHEEGNGRTILVVSTHVPIWKWDDLMGWPPSRPPPHIVMWGKAICSPVSSRLCGVTSAAFNNPSWKSVVLVCSCVGIGSGIKCESIRSSICPDVPTEFNNPSWKSVVLESSAKSSLEVAGDSRTADSRYKLAWSEYKAIRRFKNC